MTEKPTCEPDPQIEFNKETIYYLKSIERQLRQIAEEVRPQPTLASEVLWDNLNWLGGHIEYLEKEKP